MQNYDELQEGWDNGYQRPVLPPEFPQLEPLTASESFGENLRRDFFGTRLDREKSLFVFSLIVPDRWLLRPVDSQFESGYCCRDNSRLLQPLWRDSMDSPVFE